MRCVQERERRSNKGDSECVGDVDNRRMRIGADHYQRQPPKIEQHSRRHTIVSLCTTYFGDPLKKIVGLNRKEGRMSQQGQGRKYCNYSNYKPSSSHQHLPQSKVNFGSTSPLLFFVVMQRVLVICSFIKSFLQHF